MVLAHNERKLDTQAIVWAASQLKSSVRAAMCVTRSIITCVFLCIYASQLKSALHWVTIIIQEELQVGRWTEIRQSTLPSSAFTTVEHDEDTIAQSNKCSDKTIVQLPDCSTTVQTSAHRAIYSLRCPPPHLTPTLPKPWHRSELHCYICRPCLLSGAVLLHNRTRSTDTKTT